MKVRYVFFTCIVSLIINVISVYNILLGFLSLLLLLITFITHVIAKVVNKAAKVEGNERSFATRHVAGYGSQRASSIMNRISIIFGLLVVYIMTIGTGNTST